MHTDRKATRCINYAYSAVKRKWKQRVVICEGDFMAVFYVAHAFGGKKENLERAKKITHDLQVKDLANCYICPLLTFSHLEYGEIGFDAEMELCYDLLSQCDKLIVSSGLSKGVSKEVDFANLVGMEVEWLEDTKRD